MSYEIRCIVITALCSYLLGCLNGAIITSINVNKKDVRDYGSKNAGLTNFLRTFGTVGLPLVLFSDCLKAAVSLWVASSLMSPLGWGREGMLLAALFCMLGHCFPAFYDFRGGKGVLATAISVLVFDWRIGLILLGIFALCVALTRMVSLGSVLGGATLPLPVWLFGYNGVCVALAALIAALLIFMHRGNIKRILAGNERKLSFSRAGEQSPKV